MRHLRKSGSSAVQPAETRCWTKASLDDCEAPSYPTGPSPRERSAASRLLPVPAADRSVEIDARSAEPRLHGGGAWSFRRRPSDKGRPPPARPPARSALFVAPPSSLVLHALDDGLHQLVDLRAADDMGNHLPPF